MNGTVRNIADFGVFVDIGVGEDGLIHISQLADKYVESPYDVVCVGDRVRARVLRVDTDKQRISLSLRKEGGTKERSAAPPRRRRTGEQQGRVEHVAAADVPSKRSSGAVQAPRSTIGWQSRRVQKAVVSDRLSKTQQRMLKKQEPQPLEEKEEEGREEETRTDVGGLLGKLDFASIERRGKPSD